MIVLFAEFAASMRFCECSALSESAMQEAAVPIGKPSADSTGWDVLEGKSV
jgi:hypothetical protein